MATPEYYRRQTQLLLVWALATTEPSLKARLIERALDFLALANCTDDEILRTLQMALQSLGGSAKGADALRRLREQRRHRNVIARR
jgi:hypothetical protein